MYDENNSYYDRIKKQLTASQLAERNVLGRLKLAIGVLPTLHQKLLACDYVEHGWQTLGEKGTSDIPDFIIRVRRFLLNEGDIESLHREGWEIVHIEQSKNPRRPWGTIVRLLMNCCCQREFIEASLMMPNRSQINAFKVAIKVASSVGKSPKSENEWQLQHTLQYLQHLDSCRDERSAE